MMHMVEEFEPDVLFDCIWLFRTSQKYNHFKPQYLYLKVIKLNNLGEKIRTVTHAGFQFKMCTIVFRFLVESNLVIHEGLTSNGRVLPWKNGSRFEELAVAIEVGYYVRLTGTFNSSSRLEIAYAAFSLSSRYTIYACNR